MLGRLGITVLRPSWGLGVPPTARDPYSNPRGPCQSLPCWSSTFSPLSLPPSLSQSPTDSHLALPGKLLRVLHHLLGKSYTCGSLQSITSLREPFLPPALVLALCSGSSRGVAGCHLGELFAASICQLHGHPPGDRNFSSKVPAMS